MSGLIPSASESPTAARFCTTISANRHTRNISRLSPPARSTFTLAWNPTDVKNITMQTFFSVSSKLNSTIPNTNSRQDATAKMIPPTTGAGIQKVSRKRILFFRNPPRNRTPTAIARVWYMSIFNICNKKASLIAGRLHNSRLRY